MGDPGVREMTTLVRLILAMPWVATARTQG